MPSFYSEGMPEVDDTVKWYFKAWHRLSNSRDLTPTLIKKISLSEMSVYMNTFGYIDDPEQFVDVIQALDNAFIDRRRS